MRTRTCHVGAARPALRLTALNTMTTISRTPRNTTCQMGFNVNMKFMNTGPPGFTSVSDRTRKFVLSVFPKDTTPATGHRNVQSTLLRHFGSLSTRKTICVFHGIRTRDPTVRRPSAYPFGHRPYASFHLPILIRLLSLILPQVANPPNIRRETQSLSQK